MRKVALFVCMIICFTYSHGVSGEYKNEWVKYGDDKSTSYNIDKNSIVKNDVGNYHVLILLKPYKDNVLNKKLKRTDVAYVFSDQEIDLVHNLFKVISFKVYNKYDKLVASVTYTMKGGDVPKFEKIVTGSSNDSLRKYLIKHSKLK